MRSNTCVETVRTLVGVLAVALVFASCSKPPAANPRPEPTIEERSAALVSRIGGVNEYFLERAAFFVFHETVVEREARRLSVDCLDRIEKIGPFARREMPVADAKLAGDFVSTLEQWTLDKEARVRDFDKRYQIELEKIRDAFVDLRSIGETVALLESHGVSATDAHSRLILLTQTHEDARRWWLDQLARVVMGQPVEETAFAAGVRNIVNVGADAAPLRASLLTAKAEWLRLQNHIEGTNARFQWAEKTLAAVPADDPLRKTADVSSARQAFAPLEEKARALQKACLDRSREHERAALDAENEMTAFLRTFLEPVIARAKELGLELPSK